MSSTPKMSGIEGGMERGSSTDHNGYGEFDAIMALSDAQDESDNVHQEQGRIRADREGREGPLMRCGKNRRFPHLEECESFFVGQPSSAINRPGQSPSTVNLLDSPLRLPPMEIRSRSKSFSFGQCTFHG